MVGQHCFFQRNEYYSKQKTFSRINKTEYFNLTRHEDLKNKRMLILCSLLLKERVDETRFHETATL